MVVKGEGLDNETYWRLRNVELEQIQKDLRSDAGYKGKLTQLYNEVGKEIRRDINADISRFATREGLSMEEARKRISRVDVDEFADTAKQYVEEKNFSDRANRELRVYNVTMRTNRLELLQAKVNLKTTWLANEEEYLLQNHLSKTFTNEFDRQSGILGFSVPSERQLDILARRVIEAEYQNTIFSERIWQNQHELQNELDNVIRRAILRGENPRVSQSRLKSVVNETFKNKKYAADRIAITETARVQNQAQFESFKAGGYDKYIYIAETDKVTCEVCGKLDGKVFELDSTDGKNSIPPRHPFCRCHLSAYAGRKELEERLDRLGL